MTAIRREERIGGQRLILGDRLEVMQELGPVDCVVTDPPYGISHSSNYGASWNGTQIANDQDTSVRDAALRLADTTSFIVFGSWKRQHPEGTHTVLIWDKGDAAGMGDLSIPWKPNHEEIYVMGRGFRGERGPGVLRHNNMTWESKGRSHPHAKPVSLLVDLLRKVMGDTILDPFMGSGTTLVACQKLGRSGIGIEIDEDYWTIACERVHKAWIEPDLFIDAKPAAPVQERLFDE